MLGWGEIEQGLSGMASLGDKLWAGMASLGDKLWAGIGRLGMAMDGVFSSLTPNWTPAAWCSLKQGRIIRC